MPAPISSSNSSVYDPATQVSQSGDCDPSNTTCSAPPSGASQQAAPPSVTIPEVHIDGDAGKQELIKRHEARSTPSCSAEAKDAALACLQAGGVALGGIAASTTGIGFVGGLAVTLAAGGYCGRELRAFYDCETQ